jgi:PAS domain S-box-containing protein
MSSSTESMPTGDPVPPSLPLDATALEAILDEANDAHSILDQAGRLRWVNRRMCEILGYSATELLQLAISDIDPHHDERRYATTFRDAQRGRMPPFEAIHRRKDGSDFPVEIHVTGVTRNGEHLLFATPRDVTQRKESEAQRERTLTIERQARALIESILASISDAFFALDRDWRFTYVNHEMTRLVGMDEGALVGRNIWEVFPSAVQSEFHAQYRRAMESGEAVAFEAYSPKFDTWYAVRAHPGPDGLAVYLTDVGRERRAVAALAESEARFRAVQDESPDGFMLFKSIREPMADGTPGAIVDFEWVYVNPAAARIVGRPIDQFAGRRLIEEMPGNKEDGLFDLYVRVVETGEPAQREFVYRHEGLDHAFRNVAVKVGDGFAVTFSDVTARVRAERALRRSEERYALAARATHHVIWEWNIPEGFIAWSEGIATVFGYHLPDGTTPTSWPSERLHPDDRDRVVASMRTLLDIGEGATWNDAARVQRADGSWAHIEIRGSVVRDSDGRPTRAVGAIEDITSRLELEEQLRQAQKMEAVGQLAGGIAHDFNNLLTVITGNLEIVADELEEHHASHLELDEIASAAERARSLVRHLLTFSRKQVVHPKVLQFGAVVRGAERLLRRVIGEEIALDVSVADDEVRVRVDPGQLEQVVLNLAVNARDAILTPVHGYRGTGGSLFIDVAPVTVDGSEHGAWEGLAPGRYVQLTVRDTGHGIDPAILPRIFEPFFTTKDVGAGTGLGLATVFGIVRSASGAIDVHSVPGEGATFRVRLPAVAEEVPRAEHRTTAASPVASAATLLIVEDEAPLRALLRRIFERAGFSILDARHGGDALMLWNVHRSQIVGVVTDLRMPEMGGRELVRHLYRDRPDLPVLYLSGYSDLSDEGPLAPNEAFVEKPFTSEQVIHALAGLLQRKDGGAS